MFYWVSLGFGLLLGDLALQKLRSFEGDLFGQRRGFIGAKIFWVISFGFVGAFWGSSKVLVEGQKRLVFAGRFLLTKDFGDKVFAVEGFENFWQNVSLSF